MLLFIVKTERKTREGEREGWLGLNGRRQNGNQYYRYSINPPYINCIVLRYYFANLNPHILNGRFEDGKNPAMRKQKKNWKAKLNLPNNFYIS